MTPPVTEKYEMPKLSGIREVRIEIKAVTVAKPVIFSAFPHSSTTEITSMIHVSIAVINGPKLA